jgi:hypothetical protein
MFPWMLKGRVAVSRMTSQIRPEHDALPFPESLCHRCAAPPQYVRTATSIFIRCPLLPNKYPRQPVLACALFRPASQSNDLLEPQGLGEASKLL